jgi:hypothetical protein
MSNLEAEKGPAATAQIRNTVSNGEDNTPTPKPMQAKSILKQIEEVKAEASPTGNILGGKAEPTPNILGGGERVSDVFDNLSNIALPQSYLGAAAVKKQLTTVLVGRPHRQSFIRIRQGLEYAPIVGLYEAMSEGKIGKRAYIILPEIIPLFGDDCSYAQLFYGITKQGNPFIWPLKLPKDGREESEWLLSGREAIDKATTSWIRVGANMDIGAYEIFVADFQIPEPVWPDLTYGEILRIAFKKEGVIDRPDHPVILKLRGA